MPVGRNDVLAALSDPLLRRIKFSIGQTTIDPEGFRDVHAAITDGRLKVATGSDQSVAFYNMRTNTIETPRKNPPLDVGERAQLAGNLRANTGVPGAEARGGFGARLASVLRDRGHGRDGPATWRPSRPAGSRGR